MQCIVWSGNVVVVHAFSLSHLPVGQSHSGCSSALPHKTSSFERFDDEAEGIVLLNGHGGGLWRQHRWVPKSKVFKDSPPSQEGNQMSGSSAIACPVLRRNNAIGVLEDPRDVSL